MEKEGRIIPLADKIIEIWKLGEYSRSQQKLNFDRLENMLKLFATKRI
jgi:hypothetical protein